MKIDLQRTGARAQALRLTGNSDSLHRSRCSPAYLATPVRDSKTGVQALRPHDYSNWLPDEFPCPAASLPITNQTTVIAMTPTVPVMR